MEAIIRNRRGMTLGLALALTAAGALSTQTAMGAPKKVPAAQPKPASHAAKRPAVQVVRHVPLPRKRPLPAAGASAPCLLYTSDAADDLLCVDLGGRRII